MPPDWDADSPELRAALGKLLAAIEEEAPLRKQPTVEMARRWQSEMMRGLRADPKYADPKYRGAFRGEPGLEWVQVRVGERFGVAAESVSVALPEFERRLQAAVALLDNSIPPDADLDDDRVTAIIRVCAWAHAEWVRIHPFANGNGRTARLWANALAMRYGLPPFVRLRPRPDGSYGSVSEKAMRGDWGPTATLFETLLADFLEEFE